VRNINETLLITEINIGSITMLPRIQYSKTGVVRTTLQSGAFVQLLLQWKINIIDSYCVSVALDIQDAVRMCPYGHLWPARLYNIFPHYLKNNTIFWG